VAEQIPIEALAAMQSAVEAAIKETQQ
jgi:hypothetical protein